MVASALWALVAAIAAISDVLHFETLNRLLFESNPIYGAVLTAVFLIIAPGVARVSGLKKDSEGSLVKVTPLAVLLFFIGIVILGLAILFVPGFR